MKKTEQSRHIIRFRRWSRKSYAGFLSLSMSVCIGHLRKNVADRSLVKQEKNAKRIISLFELQSAESGGFWTDEGFGALTNVLLDVSALLNTSVLCQNTLKNRACEIAPAKDDQTCCNIKILAGKLSFQKNASRLFFCQ